MRISGFYVYYSNWTTKPKKFKTENQIIKNNNSEPFCITLFSRFVGLFTGKFKFSFYKFIVKIFDYVIIKLTNINLNLER